jgi:cytochrome c-type biogenesis protein CcmH/NrfG
MQTDDRILKEVRRFTLAIWVIAVSVLALTVGAAYSLFWEVRSPESIPLPAGDPSSTSPCAIEKFYRETNVLMERGKYMEVVSAADARIKDCPSDHYAWWFKAKALAIGEQWDPALEALRRAELLRPDWRRPYVVPLRESIEWNKAQKNKPALNK